jgi:hypothetical protein
MTEKNETPPSAELTFRAEVYEVAPERLSTELVFNILDGPSQEILNEKPLPEEEARKFLQKLQESDATRPLVMRSHRAILQE